MCSVWCTHNGYERQHRMAEEDEDEEDGDYDDGGDEEKHTYRY